MEKKKCKKKLEHCKNCKKHIFKYEYWFDKKYNVKKKL